MTVNQLGAQFGRKLTAADFEPWTWNFVVRGRDIPAAEYLSGFHWLQVWSRRVDGWSSGGFDLLLTPTIAEPPVPLKTLVAISNDPEAGFTRIGIGMVGPQIRRGRQSPRLSHPGIRRPACGYSLA